jgi:hypothetical protein
MFSQRKPGRSVQPASAIWAGDLQQQCGSDPAAADRAIPRGHSLPEIVVHVIAERCILQIM